MDGTIAGTISRQPTRQEMDECRKLIMSDLDVWDPTTPVFLKQRYVNEVRVTGTEMLFLPPVTNLVDSSFIDFRGRMVSAVKNISEGFRRSPYNHMSEDDVALSLQHLGEGYDLGVD